MQTKKNIVAETNTKARETRKPGRKPRTKNILVEESSKQEDKHHIDSLLNTYDGCGTDGCGTDGCVFSKKHLISTLIDDDGNVKPKKDEYEIVTEAETELFCMQLILFMISPYLMYKGIKTNDRILLSISVVGIAYLISNLGSFSQLNCL